VGMVFGDGSAFQPGFRLPQPVHRELHDAWHNVPAPAGYTQSPHMLLQKVVQLFHHQQACDAGSELSDQGIGIGIGHPQFEH